MDTLSALEQQPRTGRMAKLIPPLDPASVLARIAPDKSRLLPLIGLPSTATIQAWRSSAQCETQTLIARRRELLADDPDDQEAAEIARRLPDATAELNRLERLLADCAERDTVQATRPAECWCLGVGGGGPVPANYHAGEHRTDGHCWCDTSSKPPSAYPPTETRQSRVLILGGLLWFERWCGCTEALRLQEERRNWQQRQTAIEANELKARLEYARTDALRSAGLTDKLRAYTFAEWPNLEPNLEVVDMLADFVAARISWQGKPGLYLHGPAGRGKTSCSAVVVMDWINAATALDESHDGYRNVLDPASAATFIDVQTFLRQIKESFNASPPNTAEVTYPAYRPGLVVLDDFGAEYQTPWVRATLLEVINYRCQRRLPTVFTSNYPLDDLAGRLTLGGAEDVEASRLVGRIREMATAVEIHGDNLR